MGGYSNTGSVAFGALIHSTAGHHDFFVNLTQTTWPYSLTTFMVGPVVGRFTLVVGRFTLVVGRFTLVVGPSTLVVGGRSTLDVVAILYRSPVLTKAPFLSIRTNAPRSGGSMLVGM